MQCMDVVLTGFRAKVLDWLESRLAPGTQARYQRSRSLFLEWLSGRGLKLELLPLVELDVSVAAFVLEMKEEDDVELTKQGCVDLVATMQNRAGAPLRLSQKVLKAWQKEVPPRQADAMPKNVAFAMVTVMAVT